VLRPQVPAAPTLSIPPTHLITSAQHGHSPAPCACQHAPAPRRSIAPMVAAGAGGVVAVVAVGVVLTALLATVAITAVSVALCALVMRSLLTPNHRRR
jgi:hypothetical protein